ncbi:MAG TPA: energy-coupling factor transporter ATPase [Geobacteraceae bacterium]|nr:energy-coupling factor transporter ATPase [Geobacteraceae bacterium]
MKYDGNFVELHDVEFSYCARRESVQESKALDGLDLQIDKGEIVAIIGGNGSGKTTFARLLNALLLPTSGIVYIGGIDTKDKERLWDVRRIAGMVFQNPDNQIVGTTVAEDVAFGPENLGLEPELIEVRVRDALRDVAMTELYDVAPHLLSGGQKQRVSLAAIIAMKPECIILDEATALLDPVARKEVMNLVCRLNREEGVTVVYITHNMEEARCADRVLILDAGKVVLDGTPRDVFSHVSLLRDLGLDVPQVTELFDTLRKDGFDLPAGIVDVEEAIEVLVKKNSRKICCP